VPKRNLIRWDEALSRDGVNICSDRVLATLFPQQAGQLLDRREWR